MRSTSKPPSRSPWGRFGGWLLALLLPCTIGAVEPGRTFATPEEAVTALVTATGAQDTQALLVLFGDEAADLFNPDRVQAGHDLAEFTTAYHQARRIEPVSDSKCVLHVGESSWPFPVPLVKRDGQWQFDVAAGRDELLNRRIGENELAILETMRAYVEAQREYAAKDRDGDEVLEYAQRITSTPGRKDGLYWPPDLDGEISPLGPRVAQAQAQGYFRSHSARTAANAEPFHGYFFRILTRQGRSVPGGRYDYIIHGNMIGGFALVAWPAEYGNSGIMTFVVNQQGRVLQTDLGPRTAAKAGTMTTYNPDATWTAFPH